MTGPVAIGGLGGSGTRVVADIVRRGGLDIGTDLNLSLDNLWFTLLCKRPRWLEQAEATDGGEVSGVLALFEKAMIGAEPWTATECRQLCDAAATMADDGHDHRGSGRGAWPYIRAARMLDAPRRDGGPPRWGWKEPNSHVLLEHLAGHWRDLRFVLVVRNGLDMAFSGNLTQLHLWGPRYGVAPARDGSVARSALRYWVAANTLAIERGERLLGERFTIVRYDELCARPLEEIARIAERLDLGGDPRELASGVQMPSCVGRHHHHDLSVLDPDDVDAVEALGFSTTRATT